MPIVQKTNCPNCGGNINGWVCDRNHLFCQNCAISTPTSTYNSRYASLTCPSCSSGSLSRVDFNELLNVECYTCGGERGWHGAYDQGESQGWNNCYRCKGSGTLEVWSAEYDTYLENKRHNGRSIPERMRDSRR